MNSNFVGQHRGRSTLLWPSHKKDRTEHAWACFRTSHLAPSPLRNRTHEDNVTFPEKNSKMLDLLSDGKGVQEHWAHRLANQTLEIKTATRKTMAESLLRRSLWQRTGSVNSPLLFSLYEYSYYAYSYAMAWKASMSVLRKILISRPRQPRDKSDASPVHLDFAKRFKIVYTGWPRSLCLRRQRLVSPPT